MIADYDKGRKPSRIPCAGWLRGRRAVVVGSLTTLLILGVVVWSYETHLDELESSFVSGQLASKEELLKLQQQNTQLAAALNRATQDYQQAARSLSMSDSSLAKVQEEAKTITQQLAACQRKLADEVQTHQNAVLEMQREIDTLRSTRAATEGARSSLARLTTELEALSAAHRKLGEDAAAKDLRIIELQRQIDALNNRQSQYKPPAAHATRAQQPSPPSPPSPSPPAPPAPSPQPSSSSSSSSSPPPPAPSPASPAAHSVPASQAAPSVDSKTKPFPPLSAAELSLRRKAIKDEFQWSWNAYKRDAWGRDELHPISHRGDGGFDMGLTIIDGLDTAILMGLQTEVADAREWIAKSLRFGHQHDINLFETTIRILGGLLSAFAMTKDNLYLDKSKELADAMLMAFDTPTGLPLGTLNLNSRSAYNPSWVGGASSISEVGSLQIEWQYLSRLTKNNVYRDKVNRVNEYLLSKDVPDGLYHSWIHPDSGHVQGGDLSLGSRADSLYEYFIKQWVFSNGTYATPKSLYDKSVRGIMSRMVHVHPASNLTWIAELRGSELMGKMDHLVCFVPGMLLLGVMSGGYEEHERAKHFEVAKQLGETCYQFYARTATGLAPEIVQFQVRNPLRDFIVDPGARHNLLRPETVESLFYLWRFTHDEKWRQYAWDIFQAFKKYSRVPTGGYSNLRDVDNTDGFDPANPPQSWSNWSDKQESFWLAETLKYLYLIFSPDNLLPLHEWVFNTEAHPLPVHDTTHFVVM